MKATYLDHMGTDLTVVNNARVSFAKESDWAWSDLGVPMRPADESLIKYLARGLRTSEWDDLVTHLYSGALEKDTFEYELNRLRRLPKHWAPFANGCQVQFHIKAPIPIMRQVFKHKVGAVESEISRRYVDTPPEVFFPEWRRKAENVKQGSSDEVFEPPVMPVKVSRFDYSIFGGVNYEDVVNLAVAYYDHLIQQGVCPEQARFVLPQGAMTEARITNSLYGWANFYNARSDVTHAQREVAYLAEQIGSEMYQLFPVSWEALTS